LSVYPGLISHSILSDARMLASLNHIDIGPAYTFKYIMETNSFKFIGFLITLLSLICGASGAHPHIPTFTSAASLMRPC
jgi:hypothetical protein